MMNKIYNILLYASITLMVVLLALSIVGKANADDPIYMKPMHGRENRGVSFILSMCSDKAKQQKKLFKKIYENATVLNAGWLYGATSNPDKCTWAARFYNDPRPKRVRIHVCNSTCFKTRQNRTCQPKECFCGYNTDAEAADKFNVIHHFEIASWSPMKSLFDTYEFDSKGESVTADVNGVKMN